MIQSLQEPLLKIQRFVNKQQIDHNTPTEVIQVVKEIFEIEAGLKFFIRLSLIKRIH